MSVPAEWGNCSAKEKNLGYSFIHEAIKKRGSYKKITHLSLEVIAKNQHLMGYTLLSVHPVR